MIALAESRPSIQFDGRTYTLARFVKFNTQVQEDYIPKGQNWSNFDSIISRVELFDVFSAQKASKGFVFDYEDLSLPATLVKNPFSSEIIAKGTFYSTVHPIVFDKEIAIFKKIEGTERVVYYRFTKRVFNNHKSNPVTDPKSLLIDDVYIEKMVRLRID